MKGEFFVHRIGNEIYSTNSIFWGCFYTNRASPGTEISKGVKIGEKIDWSIVTHNGEIIHRFNQTGGKQ